MKKLHPHLYLLLLPSHVLFFYLVINLSFDLSLYFFVTTIMWILIGGIGLEITFHRIIAHKQFYLSKNMERLLSFLGCLSMNGSPTFWRAMHIGYHHPYSDSHKDPHTSVYSGKFYSYLWYINTLWKIKYVGCREYIEDNFFVYIDKLYLILLYLVVIITYLVSPFVALCLITAMIMSFHQTAMINILCHNTKLGYSIKDSKDKSRNIPTLSWITFGQSLHNNHHNYPNNANNAVRPGEIDVGYILSRLIGLKPKVRRD